MYIKVKLKQYTYFITFAIQYTQSQTLVWNLVAFDVVVHEQRSTIIYN